MSSRLSWLIAAFLALWAGGVASLCAQTYHLVTNRGYDPGELRLWEVTAEGDLTLIDVQSTGKLTFTHWFHVDPFGRFLIYPNMVDDATVYDIYEIGADADLIFRNRYTRSGWVFYDDDHVLSTDGVFLFTVSKYTPANPDDWYLEALRVTEDFNLEEGAQKFLIPDEQLGEIAPTRLGSIALPDGGYSLLTTARQSTAYINVLSVTPDGEIHDHVQQFAYPLTQPINGGFAVRQDQRIVVTGHNFPMLPSVSFSVGEDGLLTQVDLWDLDELGPWGARWLLFHPNGRSLLDGYLIGRATVSRAGEFIEPVDTMWGSGAHLAISPDGQIAVSAWPESGAIHWGVFELNPLSGFELIAEHVMNIGYTDIAFIPPRTEEILGDANGDGRRDAADLVTYLNHFNDPGVYEPWHPLSPQIRGPVPEARADVDQNGDITPDDMDLLLNFLLDIEGH